MSVKVEVCPFCLSSNDKRETIYTIGSHGSRLRRVYCADCGAQGPSASDDNYAWENWSWWVGSAAIFMQLDGPAAAALLSAIAAKESK